ncbi:MAG: type I-C CRISPR-associated protein Cas8c/Csd1 [Acidobacteria bacterium]|nr:type I-C CRISPR-associated protein Cas8c/Csd1 [Acidobacteriota bacterium]MCI0718572.1 type I-C CRISPR-associated protein Cas8c/Csd1 [Acidobacteriota bacterium]
MLLRLLYDLAQSPSRHILADLAFAPKPVRWIIELDANGGMLGEGPQLTGDDKRGKQFSCPQTTRPKVAGGVAEFLADGLTAVFGLDTDPEAKMTERKRADRDANNVRKQEDFWRQVQEAYKQTGLPDLASLLAFRKPQRNPPAFLRWGLSSDPKPQEKASWWVRTASGTEAKLGPDNFTFRVGGQLLLEDDHLRSWWRSIHANEVQQARASFQRGLCLVSGRENVPLAPTHSPKIQGVPNTQSFGAAIVSFDKDAFASYGFDQSLNAPTSEDAATAYSSALNWLLEREDHHLRLAQTSLCFWTKESEQASGLFARLLNQPDPQSVAQLLKSPWAGLERELAKRDQFYAVALAGNAGRIVVRYWIQEPLDQAIENFRRWFTDLQINVPPRPPKKLRAAAQEKEFHPLSIYWLACTTVREAKDLRSEVPSQLYRAALEGTAPSVSLIKPILDRLHSRLVRDESYNLLYDESCFALVKLILNRNRKDTDMEIAPKLIADTDDPAYNCGRLLAILAATQDKAHDYKLEGAGVAERYFGTASVSPASVFPLLLRLNRHHLNKISKSERFAGHERFIQEQIESVLTLFKPAKPGVAPMFPRTLNLQAQGRFALGFYQQAAHDNAARSHGKRGTTGVASDPEPQFSN